MNGITRREFVQTSAGLVISFYLPGRPVAARAPTAAPFAPNAWLRIGTDGIITLTLDKSEMGQGSQTGLALILAEELAHDAHRREQRDPQLVAAAPQGGRHRAGNARHGGGANVAGRPRHVPRRAG